MVEERVNKLERELTEVKRRNRLLLILAMVGVVILMTAGCDRHSSQPPPPPQPVQLQQPVLVTIVEPPKQWRTIMHLRGTISLLVPLNVKQVSPQHPWRVHLRIGGDENAELVVHTAQLPNYGDYIRADQSGPTEQWGVQVDKWEETASAILKVEGVLAGVTDVLKPGTYYIVFSLDHIGLCRVIQGDECHRRSTYELLVEEELTPDRALAPETVNALHAPPIPATAPEDKLPSPAKTERLDSIRWRACLFDGSTWGTALDAKRFRVEKDTGGYWKLSNLSLSNAIAKAVLDGWDIREGAIEFEMKTTTICEVGVGSSSGRDANRFFHPDQNQWNVWIKVRLELKNGRYKITVNDVNAVVGEYGGAQDMFTPYITIHPGKTLEVKNVRQERSSPPLP